MIYVISKSTFGSYEVRDIQCNANWCSCPYSDYAVIPDDLVEGVLATKGYCDIVLNDDGTEVVSFTARTIPSVPEECCGDNTVLSVNGIKANTAGEVTVYKTVTVTLTATGWANQTQTVTASGVTQNNTIVVAPNPTNHTAYGEAGVYCSAQASNKLTFRCEDTPTSNLSVNVVILS